MSRKFLLTILSALIYIVLVATLLTTRYSRNSPCKRDKYVDCVQFCEVENEKYTDEFLRQNFHPYSWYLDADYEIVRKTPICGLRDTEYFMRDINRTSHNLFYEEVSGSLL
jgi:hypothetical protein